MSVVYKAVTLLEPSHQSKIQHLNAFYQHIASEFAELAANWT